MNLKTLFRYLVTIAVVAALTVGAIVPPAYAFVQSNLDTLKLTKVCEKCDLSGAVLSNLRLTRANLSGANLSNANLTNASLAFADLTGADLRGAIFQGCKLGEATLKDALIDDYTMAGAVLYNTIIPSGDKVSRSFLDTTTDIRNLPKIPPS